MDDLMKGPPSGLSIHQTNTQNLNENQYILHRNGVEVRGGHPKRLARATCDRRLQRIHKEKT